MLVVTLPDHHGILKRIRNLVPTMIFIATSILMALSVTGVVVAFSVYRMEHSNGSIGTSQSLTLLSVRT